MSKETVRLGAKQLAIMDSLWNRGQATARDITDDLNIAAPTDPTAHSTVQTMLRELEAKGVVGHEVQERTFTFFPKIERGTVRETAMHDLLFRLFNNSPFDLASHLIQNKKLSTKELEQLRQLIDERSEQ